MKKSVKNPKPLTTKSGEVRELTLAEMKRGGIARVIAPHIVAARGRPRVDAPKKVISLRVDAELAKAIKQYGAGSNRKAEALLAAGFLN